MLFGIRENARVIHMSEEATGISLFPSPSLPSINRDFEDGVFTLHPDHYAMLPHPPM